MPWPHVLKYYILLQNPTISAMNSVMLLSVQFSRSVVSDFATPWTAACQASLSTTNCRSLLKLMSIKSWCHPTISSSVVPFSSCLQSFPASGSFQMNQFFASGGPSIGVSASASVLPMSTEDWFSFKMDWLDLLAVQGILKSLLQHHNSKASILWCSVFFMIQLSHLYMTSRKTIVLTVQIFAGKVMCLLFNMLSRFVIAWANIFGMSSHNYLEDFSETETDLRSFFYWDTSHLCFWYSELGNNINCVSTALLFHPIILSFACVKDKNTLPMSQTSKLL